LSAKAFSPSASTTIVTGHDRTNDRMNAAVTSLVVIPGPMAMASAERTISSRRSAGPATVPASVTGSGMNVASRSADCTTGRMSSGTATLTSPAPARYAASPIRLTAPVINLEPPITTTTPASRLCVSGGRAGSMAATSSPSVSHTSARRRSAGNPMSTTSTRPAFSAPGRSTIPSLAAPKVTVTSALTATPSTAPVSPFTPEGISTATTGPPQSFSPAMARSPSPSAEPRKPVPKMASTATSARSSSRASVAGENGRTRASVSPRCRKFAAAGSLSESGGSSITTVAWTPHLTK
jgi:hypothetical protein